MSLNNIRFMIFSVLTFFTIGFSISIPGLNGLLAILLFFFSLTYVGLKIFREKVVILLSFILMAILFSTILSATFGVITLNPDVFFRFRYWVFEVIIAISLYTFFKYENILNLQLFVKVVLLIFIAIGFWQVVVGDDVFGRRIHLFQDEPSSAGGVMMFFTGVYYYLNNSGNLSKNSKVILILSIIIMLLTGSKGAILTCILIFIYYIKLRIRNKKTFWILLLSLLLFSPVIIFSVGNKIEYTFSVLSIIYDVGLQALSYEYQVWDSFIMRFLGWYSSFSFIIQYPFGIGSGGFAQLLPSFVFDNQMTVDSRELTGVLYGGLYATPKSYFLELIVSGGVGILMLLYILFYKLDASKSKAKGDKLFLYMLVLQGFIVELAPYLAFVVVSIVLIKRFRHSSSIA